MPSLRTRFSFAFAVVCLALVGANALTVLHFSHRHEARQIDQLVLDEMDVLIEQYQRLEVSGLPHGEQLDASPVRSSGDSHSEFRKWFRSGWLTQRFVVRSAEERSMLPEELRLLAPGFHDVLAAGVPFRVEVRELGGVSFYLAYDASYHWERFRDFQWAVVVTAAVAAVVAVLAGLWLAASLTRQVAALAERVKHLPAGQALDPLGEHFHDREVNALALAFDAFQARMAALLAREKALTADVSHELRTPLTAIRTSSELLLADPELPERCRARVEKVARAAARLAELTNAILLLAREQAASATSVATASTAAPGVAASAGPTALRECIEDAVEPLADRIAAKGLQLEIDVAPDLVVPAPRHALTVVLSNLIINAVSYTERGHILLRARAATIEITDTGQGIEADKVSALFERFRRGAQRERSDGHGLGLAIVKRICDQFGWHILIENRPEGGTRVLLTVA